MGVVVELAGVTGVVAGGWATGYGPDLLLRFGTGGSPRGASAATERSIGGRLERQADDHAAIRMTEGALDNDLALRDFGQ